MKCSDKNLHRNLHPVITSAMEYLLFTAASYGDLPALKQLLKQFAEDTDILIKDSKGCSLLHCTLKKCRGEAGFRTREPLIKFLLEQAPTLAMEQDCDGATPLGLACREKLTLACCSLLLLSDPRAALVGDGKGRTPLHHVAGGIHKLNDEPDSDSITKNEMLQLAHLLLQKNASVNCEDKKGWSALHLTLEKKRNIYIDDNMEMFQFLLSRGAKLCTQSGTHALSFVGQSEEITRYLLSLMDLSEINKWDRDGWTPLHHVLEKSNEDEVIELLISKGAVTEDGTNAVDLARQNGNSFKVVELLLSKYCNYDINSKDESGKTMLIQYSSSLKNIHKLLRLGADATALADSGTNALFTAIQIIESPIEILNAVAALIAAGANVATVDCRGQNVLSLVASLFTTFSVCEQSEILDKLKLAKYLFEQPAFQNKHIANLPKQKHPQYMILLKLYNIVVYRYGIDTTKQILKLIFNSNMKDECMTFPVTLAEIAPGLRFNSCCLLGPVSYVLFKDHACNLTFDRATMEMLYLLLNHGFSISTIPTSTVSPLTMLLLLKPERLDKNSMYKSSGTSNDSAVNPVSITDEPSQQINKPSCSKRPKVEIPSSDVIATVAQDLINRDVNVNDRSLQFFSVSPCSYNATLLMGYMGRMLYLPDALWVAFLKENVSVVKTLLPYWSAPPLALLFFYAYVSDGIFTTWFPVLSEYGGIPHGTEIYYRLEKHLRDILQASKNDPMLFAKFLPIFNSFKELHSSPLSLRELSRYVVRAAVTKRRPEDKLPRLLEAICPPGLKDFLLMMPQ